LVLSSSGVSLVSTVLSLRCTNIRLGSGVLRLAGTGLSL